MMDVNPNGIYTISDLAEGLDVCKGTIYNYINEDGLEATRMRGNTYIKGSNLLMFMFPEKEQKTNLKVIKGI